MNKEKAITIFGAIFLVIVLVAVISMMVIKSGGENSTGPQSIVTKKPSLPYSLSLIPSELTATVSSLMKLDLTVDAYGENINGLDAIITYDANFLKPEEIKEGSTRYIIPRKMIEKNRVIITALRNLDDNEPTGKEVIASLYFTAKKRGMTKLDFEFFKGKTVGSTIIRTSDSSNILSEVRGSTLTIR